ncbi:unnamed protein product, partial [Acidithrix sp. C25]
VDGQLLPVILNSDGFVSIWVQFVILSYGDVRAATQFLG